MSIYRLPQDNTLANTLSGLGDQLSEAWNPKTRWEAYILQLRMQQMQLERQQAQQKENALQSALDGAAQRYGLTPAQRASIETMYRSGASQDSIDTELSAYSPLAAQDLQLKKGGLAAQVESQKTTAQRQAEADVKRKEDVKNSLIWSQMEDIKPGMSDADISAVNERNKLRTIASGKPIPDDGWIKMPNVRDYLFEQDAQRKYQKAQTTLRPGENLAPPPVLHYGDGAGKPPTAAQPGAQPVQPVQPVQPGTQQPGAQPGARAPAMVDLGDGTMVPLKTSSTSGGVYEAGPTPMRVIGPDGSLSTTQTTPRRRARSRSAPTSCAGRCSRTRTARATRWTRRRRCASWR